MIVSLLLTVEGSKPEMSRLINVDDSTTLGELSNVIEAAFGFSGTATHMYMDATGPTRNVYSANPSGGEIGESTITVGEIGPLTYVYDSAANWNLAVEPLGQSDIDGPTPLLVDTQGPDVVEACGGPSMMTRFHAESRRLAAGLVPDMQIAPLLLSFLPVMSPERILQRLTHSDHITVAERIAYVAEEMQLDAASRAPMDPRAPLLTDEFEQFLAERPDLQQIMSLDPNPQHNPTLVQALAEFFSDALLDDEAFDAMLINTAVVLEHATAGLPLEESGAMRESDMRLLSEELGFHVPQGSGTGPLNALCEVLTTVGMLHVQDQVLYVTALGSRFMVDTNAQITHLATHLPELFDEEEWPRALMWLTTLSGPYGHTLDVPPLEDPERALDIFVGLGVLSPVPEHRMTGAGHYFLANLLERHANQV